jgi:2-desacetyl-2-hydroxyethyl bacteriochlorophyllide A dehydrogenase
MNNKQKIETKALWYVSPGQLELRSEILGELASDECRVRTIYSGISRGTESLVFAGQVPVSEYQTMRCPFQEGDFPFPVKYGYSSIGLVEAGSNELIGKTVFSLFPHQDVANISANALTILPVDLSPRRAILAANMETALNAVWDAAPQAADRIVIVGAGVVGALVAYLCGQLPGADVTLVDIDSSRADLASKLGVNFVQPDYAPRNCDVVFHASGQSAGLETALSCAGNEATILELSWYGSKPVSVPLGGAFHSKRLKLISSQVGQIAPSHRPRWDYKRRLLAALNLLKDDRLEVLLAPDLQFENLPRDLPHIFNSSSGVLAQVIHYNSERGT